MSGHASLGATRSQKCLDIAVNRRPVAESASPRSLDLNPREVSAAKEGPKGRRRGVPRVHRVRRSLASIVFVAANGVHPEHGISTTNAPEADMKQRLLAAAHRRVVVADASKFSREALVRVCDLHDLDLILTAGDVESDLLAAVREQVEVQVAGVDA